jgi:hypothetical protein
MPFGMKNATSTFSKTMKEVFGVCMDKFLKVFVNDLNDLGRAFRTSLICVVKVKRN